MIGEDVREFLRRAFKNLKNDVKIVFYMGREGEDIEELLKDVSDLSEKLSLEVKEGKNVITFEGHENIEYWGSPIGNHFATLIGIIFGVSNGPEREVKGAEEINKEVEIIVFTVPNDETRTADEAVLLSLINKNIKTKIIEVYEFQDFIERYNLNVAPTVLIKVDDNERIFEGEMIAEEMLEAIESL